MMNCPVCGKPCGNNGLMVMHYRWKHNGGTRIGLDEIIPGAKTTIGRSTEARWRGHKFDGRVEHVA